MNTHLYFVLSDIKIPSEHTFCQIQYPAEYQIYMVHPVRKQTIVMSILLDLHENDENNDHLQKVIEEWQGVYDRNRQSCKESKRRNLKETNVTSQLTDKAELYKDFLLNHTRNEFNTTSQESRKLKDETPFGNNGWDPFHSSIERTIYFWGYWGSLTEPPCSTFVAWRILTEPAYISKSQLEQMKKILFLNQNEDCEYTSVHHDQSVARPTQPNRQRLLHQCTVDDYVSDKEKEAMRKKTGNPDWCC